MTELNITELKPKRKSPDISPENRAIIEAKRQATLLANRIKKANGLTPQKEPRIISETPNMGRPKTDPNTLIKGSSSESSKFRCHFAEDHPRITFDDLNKDAEYAIKGRTFPPLKLELAKEYQRKNHGSVITTLTDYYDRDFTIVTERDENGEKISSKWVLKPNAQKHIVGYLVSTPNKKCDETPMFSTMHLAKK